MLTLSAIYLHNWHRFTHTLLEVRDSLYLAGHNGSGKSSILDALQMLLVANLGAVRFNASAQDRSERTLESYVRGKVGEGGWLRPHNTVAYLAAQFTNTDNGAQITLGVCIEASEGHDTERIYFVLAEPLDPSVFFAKDTPLTRRELRQFCRQRTGAQAFDQIEEYQDVMLNSLGGLNPRFVGLFVRALRFQPVGSINAFVETWLLPEEQLDLATFQHVVQRLGDLERHAHEVREKVEALNAIVDRQGEIARLGDRRAEYIVLTALLRRMLADQRVTALVTQQTDQDAGLRDTERNLAQVRADLAREREALLEARVALKQSAVIQQRDALRAQGQALRSTCEAMEGRWKALLNDLQRERRQLEPLLEDAAIEPEARRSLAAFLELIDLQRPDDPPSPSLAQLFTLTEPLLLEEQERTLQEYYRLKGQERALVEDTHRLQLEIADLEARGVSFPPSVERVRTILAARIGTVPPLVCECLEINDERWQNAVEALLGDHRFVIVVPPAYVAGAVQLLEDLRSRGDVYDVGVLDSEHADEQVCLVHPQSLTRFVEIKHPLLGPYLHGLLGAVIACDNVDELRQHARAVTVDVMVGADQVIRALPYGRYDLWYIGERAQRAQIELRQRRLTEVHARLTALEPHLKRMDKYRQCLDRVSRFEALRSRLAEPLDSRPLRSEEATIARQLAELDLQGVRALEWEVERSTARVHKGEEEEHLLYERRVALKNDLLRLERELHTATQEAQTAADRASAATDEYPGAIARAQELLVERLGRPDLQREAQSAESTAQNFETRAGGELDAYREQVLTFNLHHSFAGDVRDPHDRRYAEERDRLSATALPTYQEQIADERLKADEILRNHVLHRLREKVHQARKTLDDLNYTLYRLPFRGEKYRFRTQPAGDPQLREIHDLIEGSQIVGKGSLFESTFYQQNKDTFDRFYESIIRVPTTDAERATQQRLMDYRRYLNYDIEVTHADGQTSRLSRILGQTSGGETQTPFYLVIAASFVQLYRIQDRLKRPTIRLIAFDEAFDKMDQERISATLELFNQYGLQIIAAAPLERCEYLTPHVCTSLVLTAMSDRVLVDSYQNYAAQLVGTVDGG